MLFYETIFEIILFFLRFPMHSLVHEFIILSITSYTELCSSHYNFNFCLFLLRVLNIVHCTIWIKLVECLKSIHDDLYKMFFCCTKLMCVWIPRFFDTHTLKMFEMLKSSKTFRERETVQQLPNILRIRHFDKDNFGEFLNLILIVNFYNNLVLINRIVLFCCSI